jgi:hypothetical protein
MLSACNLFNPTGSGDLQGKDNVDNMIEYGNDLLRQNKYSQAGEQFGKALKLDSTKSQAYFGLAKARIREYDINPLELMGMVSVGDTEIPFVSEPNEVKTKYYQGLTAVHAVFTEWVRRDTLTELWEYSRTKAQDPDLFGELSEKNKTRVQNFETVYGIYNPGSKDWPLSDRKVKYSRIQIDFALTSFITTMLGFLDLNRDGILDDRDLNLGITRDENGNLSIDVEQVMEQAVSDPEVAKNMNSKLEDLAKGTENIGSLLSTVSQTLGGGAGGQEMPDTVLSEEATSELEKQIADMGDAVLFYKMGDGIDNDGDGCVDEEIYDGLDNDGDGLIDEDLRVASLDPNNPLTYLMDLVDNDWNGMVDDADENTFIGPADEAKQERYFAFTQNFIPNVKGEINTEDIDLKLRVQKDTTGTVYNLQMRKDSVGGCWSYMTEADFQSFIINQSFNRE